MKKQKTELKYFSNLTHQRDVRTKGKAEGRTGRLKKKQSTEPSKAEKGVKKSKLDSCRPKYIKPKPNSPVSSTLKDGVIRCPACEEVD